MEPLHGRGEVLHAVTPGNFVHDPPEPEKPRICRRQWRPARDGRVRHPGGVSAAGPSSGLGFARSTAPGAPRGSPGSLAGTCYLASGISGLCPPTAELPSDPWSEDGPSAMSPSSAIVRDFSERNSSSTTFAGMIPFRCSEWATLDTATSP